MPRDNKIVYNNATTGLEKNESEGTLTKQFKKKQKSIKCSNCAWSTTGARKHPNMIYTMSRVYTRHKHGWTPIGWYCEQCGSIVLDELVKPKYGYFHPPDPKITILKIKWKE